MLEPKNKRNIIDYSLKINRDDVTWEYDIGGRTIGIDPSKFSDEEINNIQQLLSDTEDRLVHLYEDMIINLSSLYPNVKVTNDWIIKEYDLDTSDNKRHMIYWCMMQQSTDPILLEPVELSASEYHSILNALQSEDQYNEHIVKLKKLLKKRYVESFYYDKPEGVRSNLLSSSSITIRLVYYKNSDIDPKFYLYIDDTDVDTRYSDDETYCVCDII